MLCHCWLTVQAFNWLSASSHSSTCNLVKALAARAAWSGKSISKIIYEYLWRFSSLFWLKIKLCSTFLSHMAERTRKIHGGGKSCALQGANSPYFPGDLFGLEQSLAPLALVDTGIGILNALGFEKVTLQDRPAIWCYLMLFDAISCYLMLFDAIWCYLMLFDAICTCFTCLYDICLNFLAARMRWFWNQTEDLKKRLQLEAKDVDIASWQRPQRPGRFRWQEKLPMGVSYPEALAFPYLDADWGITAKLSVLGWGKVASTVEDLEGCSKTTKGHGKVVERHSQWSSTASSPEHVTVGRIPSDLRLTKPRGCWLVQNQSIGPSCNTCGPRRHGRGSLVNLGFWSFEGAETEDLLDLEDTFMTLSCFFCSTWFEKKITSGRRWPAVCVPGSQRVSMRRRVFFGLNFAV